MRQAILYAADQDAVNDILYDGYYAKSEGPLNNNHPCFWEWRQRDVQDRSQEGRASCSMRPAGSCPPARRSARHPASPGVADGTPLKLRYNVLHHKEIGEVLQQQLRKAGIDLAVEVVPGPVQIERVRNRDFELMYERQRSPDPGDPRPGLELQMGPARRLGLDRASRTPSSTRPSASCDRCPIFAGALRGGEGGAEDHHGERPDASDAERSGFRRLSTDKVKGFQIGSEGNWFFVNNTTVAK